MWEILTSAFTLGLLSSFHCVGMCGPIALALPFKKSKWPLPIAILINNFGRILTYFILGGFFGLLGYALQIANLQQFISIFFGACMMLWAIWPKTFYKFLKINQNLISGFVKKGLSKLISKSSTSALFTIGILNGLLPCGLVYVALAMAITTQQFIYGALFMTLFGIGTLPSLFIVGFLGQKISLAVQVKIKKLIPIAVFILGLLLFLRGLDLGIMYLSPKITHTPNPIEVCE